MKGQRRRSIHDILKDLEDRKGSRNEKLLRKVNRRILKFYYECDKAYRAAMRIYIAISNPPWSTDPLAVEIAAKLKEDCEASPTT